MNDSILTSIKKLLGIAEEYEHFDLDVITHINTAFLSLNQLGIGPEKGCSIFDKSTTWEQLFGDDPRFEAIKSYVWLKVKLLFDPPANSSVAKSYEQTIAEMEFRLIVLGDETRRNSKWDT